MFINTVDLYGWPEDETTYSQDKVAQLRPTMMELRQTLEELDPRLPSHAEAGSDDLKDIKVFIQRVIKLFDDSPEYWSEEYLREVDAS
ncbi:MAG: hypothetical protein VBE63_25980 [Lamprobacter sp.]|uniref:hypothetical protein n=1 Tax=Lamprobacter sp. TaxID=3100796 RepID=UPI002B25B798|nr:hypothetical protein [Lamprobacter sp.]MEA3643357.1 hypothetical protein [Lamprobacter sp.]